MHPAAAAGWLCTPSDLSGACARALQPSHTLVPAVCVCLYVSLQIPLGAGLGFAHKYLKDGGVSFTFYGDGAANQGQAFEAFNMAGLWDLPVVFVCKYLVLGPRT